jgi:hypothetical protein
VAWTTDLVLMVRVLISDLSEPQTYADEYLERVLVTAGIMVDAEFPFSYDYTYDIGALTISPDPVTSADNIFMALVPLKAACILTQGEFKQALGQGIKVRDGDSAIDTSVSFRGYRDILELGPCAAYDKLKWSILATGEASGGGVGKAVFGPYREPDGDAFTTISWYYDQFVVSDVGRRDRS